MRLLAFIVATLLTLPAWATKPLPVPQVKAKVTPRVKLSTVSTGYRALPKPKATIYTPKVQLHTVTPKTVTSKAVTPVRVTPRRTVQPRRITPRRAAPLHSHSPGSSSISMLKAALLGGSAVPQLEPQPRHPRTRQVRHVLVQRRSVVRLPSTLRMLQHQMELLQMSESLR